MPVVLSVCASASPSDRQLRRLRIAQSTRANSEPTDAASVGVNHPTAIPVSTQITNAARSSTRKIAARRSAHDIRAEGGAMEGRILQTITMVAMYSNV